MNNQEVAKNWREQTGRVKNGSSMYYEGRIIYSYGSHFPMALITDKKHNGDTIIIQNSDGYSNSTAKHLNHMRSQCYNDAVLRVPTKLLKNTIDYLEYKYGTVGGIKSQIDEFIREQITKSEGKLKRARTTKWLHESDIEGYKKELEILKSL